MGYEYDWALRYSSFGFLLCWSARPKWTYNTLVNSNNALIINVSYIHMVEFSKIYFVASDSLQSISLNDWLKQKIANNNFNSPDFII